MPNPFQALGLSATFTPTLEQEGLTTPTPIQKQAIPTALAGKDLLGIAKTGSGKTAAFALPILQSFLDSGQTRQPNPTSLILAPTRELAEQIGQTIQTLSQNLSQEIHTRTVYGGVAINPQMQSLRTADIIIATPGRLLDLIDKNAVKLHKITTLVLDEADKMLNLGFKAELDAILEKLPTKRQNLLFSATLSPEMEALKTLILTEPQIIQIEAESDTLDLIQQLGYYVTEERKGPLLRYLIKEQNLQQVLVFASSTHKVDSIVDKLRKNKIQAAAIHGQRSQTTRRDSLAQFKSGDLRVLVATDLLARGIDIAFLPCVINYELPRSPKDYIHRIGRTGRAENPGQAISLITQTELPHLKTIQKKIAQKIPMHQSDQINLHGY